MLAATVLMQLTPGSSSSSSLSSSSSSSGAAAVTVDPSSSKKAKKAREKKKRKSKGPEYDWTEPKVMDLLPFWSGDFSLAATPDFTKAVGVDDAHKGSNYSAVKNQLLTRVGKEIAAKHGGEPPSAQAMMSKVKAIRAEAKKAFSQNATRKPSGSAAEEAATRPLISPVVRRFQQIFGGDSASPDARVNAGVAMDSDAPGGMLDHTKANDAFVARKDSPVKGELTYDKEGFLLPQYTEHNVQKTLIVAQLLKLFDAGFGDGHVAKNDHGRFDKGASRSKLGRLLRERVEANASEQRKSNRSGGGGGRGSGGGSGSGSGGGGGGARPEARARGREPAKKGDDIEGKGDGSGHRASLLRASVRFCRDRSRGWPARECCVACAIPQVLVVVLACAPAQLAAFPAASPVAASPRRVRSLVAASVRRRGRSAVASRPLPHVLLLSVSAACRLVVVMVEAVPPPALSS